MPHQIFVLKNGIRLIHQEVNSPIAHFGILVNAGSRDEADEKMGLAHFVEHTIFKGTQKRKAYQIINRLENAGGELNAATSKEETHFYASFLSNDYPKAIELLSDIFFHATFPEKEMEKEKDVIIEEMNYYKDTPTELIFDEFENVVFKKHPLGRSILGTKKTVNTIQQQDIFDFIFKNYLPEHIVLSSVGSMKTNKVVALCEKHFGNSVFPNFQRKRQPFVDYQPTQMRKNKSVSQSHILLGNIAYSLKNKKKDAFLLLTNLLGGQAMNSRLNVAIREKKGYAYAVEANYTPLSDTGLFAIYIGCDLEMEEKCMEISFKEMKKLMINKLGTQQLHYAKRQLIGQIAIANESKLAEMIVNGRSLLAYGKVETIEETIAKVEKITAEEIMEVANEIFIEEHFSSLIYARR